MKEVADNVSVKKSRKRLQVWVSNEDDVNKFAIISLQRFFSLIDENNDQDQGKTSSTKSDEFSESFQMGEWGIPFNPKVFIACF